jgi:hypothetical protein
MISRVLYAVGGFIEGLIGLRIILRLLGANPDSSFVRFIYSTSRVFVAPFAGIFGQDSTVVGGVGAVISSVFDWTAVIALIVIAILMGIIIRVLTPRRVVTSA